jgi:hypothetical protein
MKQLAVILCCALLFVMGCDILEEPYRKGEVQLNTSRKVLLEEYTGHLCPNCPTASKQMMELKGLYGDNLVMIAIHAGVLANSFGSTYNYDFKTETGNIWFDYFGVESAGVPNGMVNRKERSGSRIIAPGSWGIMIQEELSLPVEAEIQLTASYDPTSRLLSVQTTNTLASPVLGEQYFINVVLIEDSIVKPQKNNNPAIGPNEIPDYVHNHVLRMSFTGGWGVLLNPQVVDMKGFDEVLDVSSDIVPENSRLVAFITNSSREVLQAEEIRLIP